MLAMDTSKLLTIPNNIEIVTVEILASNPCRICLLCNPPNSGTDYQDHLLSYVSLLMEEEVPIVIMGDFNTPDINWSMQSANSQFSSNLIFQHNYTQLVEYSIHIHGNILDLISTNCDKNIASLLLLKSDHYPVTLCHITVVLQQKAILFTCLTTQRQISIQLINIFL